MKKVAWCVSKWRILQPLSYQPPATQLYTLRGSGLEKSRILALDSWGAHQRNHFSEARLLHLPIPRKVLNSLTWDTWISLLVICWHVRLLTWPLWQKLPYILPLPLPLQSGPSKPSERLSSGLKSESPPNKTQFSTFRLCSFQSTYFTKQRCPSLTSYSPLQSVTSQPLGMQRELREEARGGLRWGEDHKDALLAWEPEVFYRRGCVRSPSCQMVSPLLSHSLPSCDTVKAVQFLATSGHGAVWI